MDQRTLDPARGSGAAPPAGKIEWLPDNAGITFVQRPSPASTFRLLGATMAIPGAAIAGTIAYQVIEGLVPRYELFVSPVSLIVALAGAAMFVNAKRLATNRRRMRVDADGIEITSYGMPFGKPRRFRCRAGDFHFELRTTPNTSPQCDALIARTNRKLLVMFSQCTKEELHAAIRAAEGIMKRS